MNPSGRFLHVAYITYTYDLLTSEGLGMTSYVAGFSIDGAGHRLAILAP